MIHQHSGLRILLSAALGTAAFGLGLGLASPAAQAQSVQRFGATVPVEASTFETVLDAGEMAEVEAINERMDKHLSLDSQGLVQLDADLTAAEVGVSQEFLDNYRLALGFSNELIASGQIKVDANLKVSATGNFVGSVSAPGPGNPGGKGKMGGDSGLDGAVDGSVTDGMVTDGDVPEWCSWRYNSGAMYYNSYNTWNTYGRTGQYYGLCNSMAAYIGYPWMSSSLNNLYTYNNSYFNNYCYPNQGSYFFLPYSSQNTCNRGYNPCYNPCSYKPAYYWSRTYTYSYSCRCYQYQWQWTGTWSRY